VEHPLVPIYGGSTSFQGLEKYDFLPNGPKKILSVALKTLMLEYCRRFSC
jgi:hypothetical protein